MGTYRVAIWLACLLLVALAGTTHAQISRYSPQRSTVSPYLNLTRTNFGGVPNYYSLVRPQLQQQAFNAAQLDYRNQQSRQMDNLSSRIDASQQGIQATGSAAWFMTTAGPNSSYLNTRRYYPQVSVGR